MFEERCSDVLRINLQENDEMILFKDLAQKEMGLAMFSNRNYFMINFSNCKEKNGHFTQLKMSSDLGLTFTFLKLFHVHSLCCLHLFH